MNLFLQPEAYMGYSYWSSFMADISQNTAQAQFFKNTGCKLIELQYKQTSKHSKY